MITYCPVCITTDEIDDRAQAVVCDTCSTSYRLAHVVEDPIAVARFATILFCPVCCDSLDATEFTGWRNFECPTLGHPFSVDLDLAAVVEHGRFG
jgi:uncharacterized protein YbaR (Trm112 family)